MTTQAAAGATRPRVLVVDDDRLVLATLGAGLRHAGYDAREAASGEEALRLCETERPDIVLLDVRMPEMDGVQAARLIRERFGIPFLFLSAYSDEALVRQAAAEGALGYLVKPLDVVQLAPSLEAALARAREIRALRESEERLTRALGTSRDTATAVGLVMERYRLDRQAAFEALRQHARSQRRKLEDVAAEMLRAAEASNLPRAAVDFATGRPVDR